MEPENIRFGGGTPVSIIHPLVVVAMAAAILLILYLRRQYVITPMLLAIFLIPKGQQLVIAGLHFNSFRIIILAGLVRWAMSRRSSRLVGGFSFLDRAVLFFALSYWTIYSLQWLQIQAFIKGAGDILDLLGGYFVFRFLIRDEEDIRGAIKALALVAILSGLCMLNEQRTGENIFVRLGGFPREIVRDSKIRSQGPFEYSITAGAFGATLLPLLVWLWSQAKARTISFLGILGATVMSFTCYASTTLATYAAAIAALCCWPIRKRMRLVRWGIVAGLVGLQIVMHGPVWSLLEHIDLTGSSSGYHRYMLIDNFIRHFGDWWLLGTNSYGSWGWEMWDTCNQYVAYGLMGGFLSFVLFVFIICKAFSNIGTARRVLEGERRQEWFLWCLGAALFSHVIAYFGIGYFDQVEFAWLVLLAIVSIAVFEAHRLAKVGAKATADPQIGSVPNGVRTHKLDPVGETR